MKSKIFFALILMSFTELIQCKTSASFWFCNSCTNAPQTCGGVCRNRADGGGANCVSDNGTKDCSGDRQETVGQ
jgi:hypothetical protein